MNFIKNIFSLEERKASTVMLTYVCFSAIGIYLLFTTGNIPIPLSYIIISLAGLIAGVNLAPQMMSMMNQNSSYGGYNSSGSYGMSSQYNSYPATTTSVVGATTQPTTQNTNKEPTNMTNSPV